MKGLSDSFKLYNKNVTNSIDITTYRKIISLYIKFIIDKLGEGKIIKLPEGLGSIGFVGRKIKPQINEDGSIKRLTVNWKETKDYWKQNPEAKESKKFVYHFNEHTCGIRYRFVWYKKGSIVRNKNFYVFVPARAVKRLFAKLIIEEQREFLVSEEFKKLKDKA